MSQLPGRLEGFEAVHKGIHRRLEGLDPALELVGGGAVPAGVWTNPEVGVSLLERFFDQQNRIAAVYRRRSQLRDVDPETGEELSVEDDPSAIR